MPHRHPPPLTPRPDPDHAPPAARPSQPVPLPAPAPARPGPRLAVPAPAGSHACWNQRRARLRARGPVGGPGSAARLLRLAGPARVGRDLQGECGGREGVEARNRSRGRVQLTTSEGGGRLGGGISEKNRKQRGPGADMKGGLGGRVAGWAQWGDLCKRSAPGASLAITGERSHFFLVLMLNLEHLETPRRRKKRN